VDDRSPLLRTPLPRSDTTIRNSFKNFLVRRSAQQRKEDRVDDLFQDVVGHGSEGREEFVAEKVEGERLDAFGEEAVTIAGLVLTVVAAALVGWAILRSRTASRPS
jgi:hypothetical protein